MGGAKAHASNDDIFVWVAIQRLLELEDIVGFSVGDDEDDLQRTRLRGSAGKLDVVGVLE